MNRDHRGEPETRERVEDLLGEWVSKHPQPDTPTIVFLGRAYSPRDLLDEVQGRTEFGEEFVSYLYDSSRTFQVPIADFIRRTIESNRRYLSPTASAHRSVVGA